MERVKWTDERIDERMAVIDEKLDRQLEATRALQEQLRSGFSGTHASFSELRAEIGALRQRTDAGFSEQYQQTLALHRQMIYIVVSFMVALLGLLAAAVAQM